MSQALRLPSHETAALFDPDALIAEVQQLGTSVEGEKRTAVAQRLKAVLAESSAKAEALLLKERQGGRCAARLTRMRSEEHTSELQSHLNLVCRLLLEKKKTHKNIRPPL